MLNSFAFTLALASLAAAQETTSETAINPQTISPILPSVTVNTSALTSTTATIDGTATTLACIPESEIIYSIQTDTVLGNEPAPTPICAPTSSVILPGPTHMGNLTTTTATTAATVNGTVSQSTATFTTTASESASGSGSQTSGSGSASGSGSGSSSAPAETRSGNPAAKNAVGGVAGIMGLAAGMLVW